VADLQEVPRSPVAARSIQWPRRWGTWGYAASVVGLLALMAAINGGLKDRQTSVQIRDPVLIGDVDNLTHDPVFDGTLKQGLEVQLAQSPFLRLLPPWDVSTALPLTGRRRDDAVTPEVARELCLRNGIKAFITGPITPMG